MNRRRFILGSCLLTALAAGAVCYYLRVSGTAPATPSAAPAAPRVQMVNGESVLTLAPDTVRANGIELSPLAAQAPGAVRSAYASIIDLQPFFDLAQRLAAAQVERDLLTVQAQASQAQYERVQTLYRDERNMSEKSVQEARTLALSDRARLRINAITRDALLASLRQQFGDALAQAAAQPATTVFLQLSSGKAALARVTSASTDNAPFPEHITLATPQGQRVAARKLSPSPQVDPALQGVSYLYLVERFMPTGTRTFAYLAAAPNSPTVAGVAIPASAIVWYGGQRWSYVRSAPDRYTRRAVSAADDTPAGVVVTKGFSAGEAVVTRGAQLLLSEEQRPQGIATQCKDPPECDD
jgi:multidrug efflux system membrane fusion protein